MSEVSRREVLGLGAAVAGGAAMVAEPAGGGPAAADVPSGGDPHRALLATADPLWRRLPADWRQGPFLGDGLLGVQLYAGDDARTLTWMLGHSEVQDQRPQWEAGIGLSRLPVGSLAWTFNGEITAVDWRLDLWDAELRGSVTTTRGSVEFRAQALNAEAALLVEIRPGAGERDAAWRFDPLPSATDRTKNRPPDYTPNPAPERTVREGVDLTRQPLAAGGDYATAWRLADSGDESGSQVLACAVRYRYPQGGAADEAQGAVQRLLNETPDALVRRHRHWWNGYFTRSWLSVPDKTVQSFYWIQVYKLAAATRRHAPVTAEWGPWYPWKDPWTAVWWNLNAQVAYWPIHGSNHTAELDAITRTFAEHSGNLPQSLDAPYRDRPDLAALAHPSDRSLRPGAHTVGVPGTAHITDNFGNLIWALHNVWLSYRHTLDASILREVLHPLLTRAVNFYAEFLTEGEDGLLHLATTRSPEYANAEDCTYDLSLLRWGCATLLESAAVLGLDGEPDAKRWQAILDRLTPYHADPEQGVLIGADVPLADSHRHFSHLLWLYPLFEKTWASAGDREAMRRTFDHWASMQSAWHGYSLAAACSMLAAMDAGDEGLGYLTRLLDGEVIGNTVLTENTFYREGGNGAIETPFCAAQSVLDLVGQSWGGVLRPFAALPSDWPDASIAGMRMQGAFLVDADRRAGATAWVRVRSERGAPCVLRPGIEGELAVDGAEWEPAGTDPAFGGRLIRLRLEPGGEALIHPAGPRPGTPPRNVPGPDVPQWGLP
ncbi:hypothetical protein BIV57_19530 [Mangrovactinospora gilvigrisea]|uniref:Tat pathway signal sequence domain protein n=1 Tax=Mangrovactinospora gilvigrisea TaxID=1428644 RepID=A0A1J7BB16_9ACTN|nr:hypothetical protein [Mangrovactinospora gilvigrisea]OIV35814.1 hypothetical protein BIV57_19530 [Mangrovactinospora gilvigrisea]